MWQFRHFHTTYVFTLHHTCSHLKALTNQLTASSRCSHITLHQTNHSFDRDWHLPSSLEISQGVNQNTTKLDCKTFGKISKGYKQFKLKVGVKSLIYFNVTDIAVCGIPTATDLLYIWPWEKRIPSELSFIIGIMQGIFIILCHEIVEVLIIYSVWKHSCWTAGNYVNIWYFSMLQKHKP